MRRASDEAKWISLQHINGNVIWPRSNEAYRRGTQGSPGSEAPSATQLGVEDLGVSLVCEDEGLHLWEPLWAVLAVKGKHELLQQEPVLSVGHAERGEGAMIRHAYCERVRAVDLARRVNPVVANLSVLSPFGRASCHSCPTSNV
jgi:hypothetical protein